ncbi:DUF721 domain-containing protein [Treponema vincentii]|uniref:DUF721 domain-containing protein n=1 Tax=Treponema vincentii TaxID=69710 RepID=UPI0035F5A922
MQSDIKKLAELITAYLDKVGLFEQSQVLEVYASWASIIGEKQAGHSKLIDIKHQTAIIEVDHSGWSQQILLNKRYIIRNFQKKYPQLGVENISVIVSSHHTDSQHTRNNTAEIHSRKKDKTDTAPMQQEPPIKAKNSDTAKNELPPEIQDAFEKLKKSIIERNR